MSKQPSIILFVTDQHQAGMLGCAGDPLVKTPNIDAMAASGTRFDRFYVAMPSCMPNRASILTSLYPSVNGVRFNGLPLPQNNVTFPQIFHNAGYRTGLMGKGHLQPILPPYQDGPDDQQQWWRQELDGRGKELNAPYYGYDDVSIVTGHGDNCGGHYETWLSERLPDYKDYIGPENQLPHDYTCPQAVRTKLPEDLYSTSYIADQAIAFLEEHDQSGDDQPFMLVVSFPDPHHPFNPPGKYWDMYDPDDVTLPGNFGAPDTDVLTLAAVRTARCKNQDDRESYGAVSISEREAREAIALTYGMITMVDDAIGRIRNKVSDLVSERETVQIFTSDHGDLLGDHGLMLKGPLHYQSLIRVPFILQDPQVSDHSVEASLCSGVDIGVSLLDRAGLAPPDGVHGSSFYQVIGDPSRARESLLIEDEYQQPVVGLNTSCSLRTLVTDHWRLTVFSDEEWGELYDLCNDPDESRNLWDEPSVTVKKASLMAQLVQKLIEATDRRSHPKSLA